MTCTEFERLLDQQTDAQTMETMQRHAAQCPHCRMLLELRALDQDEQVPEEVSARWKAALRTEQAKERMDKQTKGFFKLKLLAPLAAVAAVLVAAVALRQPIANVSRPQVTLTAAPAMKAMEQQAAPGGDDGLLSGEAVTGSAVEPNQAMQTLAPTPAAQATRLPLAADEAVSEDAPVLETAYETEALPEAEDGDAVNDEAPAMEAAMDTAAFKEPAEEALFMQQEAESAAFVDAEEAMPAERIIRWASARPSETLRTLLTALNRADDCALAETAEDGSMTLSLEIAPAEWTAFLAGLEAAGCADLPEAAGAEGKPVPVRLIIEKTEEP